MHGPSGPPGLHGVDGTAVLDGVTIGTGSGGHLFPQAGSMPSLAFAGAAPFFAGAAPFLPNSGTAPFLAGAAPFLAGAGFLSPSTNAYRLAETWLIDAESPLHGPRGPAGSQAVDGTAVFAGITTGTGSGGHLSPHFGSIPFSAGAFGAAAFAFGSLAESGFGAAGGALAGAGSPSSAASEPPPSFLAGAGPSLSVIADAVARTAINANFICLYIKYIINY